MLTQEIQGVNYIAADKMPSSQGDGIQIFFNADSSMALQESQVSMLAPSPKTSLMYSRKLRGKHR